MADASEPRASPPCRFVRHASIDSTVEFERKHIEERDAHPPQPQQPSAAEIDAIDVINGEAEEEEEEEDATHFSDYQRSSQTYQTYILADAVFEVEARYQVMEKIGTGAFGTVV